MLTPPSSPVRPAPSMAESPRWIESSAREDRSERASLHLGELTGAGVEDRPVVALSPCFYGGDRFEQGPAEVGELIFDLGRYDGVDGALDDPVALEGAQRLREDLRGDLADAVSKLREPEDAGAQGNDDQHRPLVAEAADH